MKEIKLTQGRVALVDDNDFERINQFKWYFSHGYAMKDTRKERTYMHRLIVGASKGQIVDHINRNSLDNRRTNLRLVTQSGNIFNTGMWKHNTSGFRGVTWNKRDKKWQAQIKKMQKNHILGKFDKIEDAVRARLNAETTYFHA